MYDKSLTIEQTKRYSRHIFLPEIGGAGQQKLKAASILVVGAGGLGSPVLSYCCAAGVGTIGIIDDDKVDISNLQRQIIHNTRNIGQAKTISAAAHLAAINPDIHIHTYHVKLDATNAAELLENYDIIIDGCDNSATRYLIADIAHSVKKPCIIGAIEKYNGYVTVLKPFENNNPSYRDLFPIIPEEHELGSCSTQGVLASLPGIIGSIQATEAIKLITNIGLPLIGRLLIYKSLECNFQIINY